MDKDDLKTLKLIDHHSNLSVYKISNKNSVNVHQLMMKHFIKTNLNSSLCLTPVGKRALTKALGIKLNSVFKHIFVDPSIVIAIIVLLISVCTDLTPMSDSLNNKIICNIMLVASLSVLWALMIPNLIASLYDKFYHINIFPYLTVLE